MHLSPFWRRTKGVKCRCSRKADLQVKPNTEFLNISVSNITSGKLLGVLWGAFPILRPSSANFVQHTQKAPVWMTLPWANHYYSVGISHKAIFCLSSIYLTAAIGWLCTVRDRYMGQISFFSVDHQFVRLSAFLWETASVDLQSLTSNVSFSEGTLRWNVFYLPYQGLLSFSWWFHYNT